MRIIYNGAPYNENIELSKAEIKFNNGQVLKLEHYIDIITFQDSKMDVTVVNPDSVTISKTDSRIYFEFAKNLSQYSSIAIYIKNIVNFKIYPLPEEVNIIKV